MPELPEVEVTRISFVDRIAGARIESVRMGKALRWPLGCAPELLHGRLVSTVRRRGKYLLVDMSEGILLLHLGMSGSLSFAPIQPPAGAHDHFDMLTSRGVLRLNDPRRFGAVVYAAAEDDPAACKLLGRLGMEPLSDKFEAAVFHTALQRRRSPIKTVLLGGEVVVGVGNIYASEALFMAAIHPASLASAMSRPQAQRLHAAIKQVLARAVEQGGSSLRDFSNAHGEAGHFQLEAMVYGRANLPCKLCGEPIQMIRQGQRSTYFCMHCQPP